VLSSLLWIFWPERRFTLTGQRYVTSDSGLTTDPAPSADGSLIAYASDRSGEGKPRHLGPVLPRHPDETSDRPRGRRPRARSIPGSGDSRLPFRARWRGDLPGLHPGR
jgi:hypothetical protein